MRLMRFMPEELDNADSLIEEEPAVFGGDLAALHREMGTKILGGCCGTDERHIGDLAARLANDQVLKRCNATCKVTTFNQGFEGRIMENREGCE